jgi:hypothetical protein
VNAETRALLEAIHDAIDLPNADSGEDGRARDRLLDFRALHVAASLEALLKTDGDPAVAIKVAAESIQKYTADKPVTYQWQVRGHRSVDGREALATMADLARDFKGTIAARRSATAEQEEHRAELAEHCGHRVELRCEDGTVVARGELLAVTICGAHLGFREVGEAFVPLASCRTVVRLQAVRDMDALIAQHGREARR